MVTEYPVHPIHDLDVTATIQVKKPCCSYIQCMQCYISALLSMVLISCVVSSIILISTVTNISNYIADPEIKDVVQKIVSIINITCRELNC